jgi:hypothetical protein
MCFVRYGNGIACTVCNAAQTFFLDMQNFEEIFGIPPCAPDTYAAVPLVCHRVHPKNARSLQGYSQQPLCDPISHLPSQIFELLF